MIDITKKSNTLRKAIASATVHLSMAATMKALLDGTVPKGNVLESARIAALFAVKRTSDMIPDCHPIPIEYTVVRFETDALSIRIEVEVQTIYKTGVEVEAMHAASVAALTIYDMLKPIDKGIEIGSIRLLEKKGGKSDLKIALQANYKAALIVCSDSISTGKKEDTAGKAIIEKLKIYPIEFTSYEIIPDDIIVIRESVKQKIAAHLDLIFVTGGTGLSHRDNTPEALKPLITQDIPGIMETARAYGQQRIPTAMLSRGLAGFAGESLVLSLPGSKNGVEESLAALFPHILHVFSVRKDESHQDDPRGAGKK
ncbi:MAG: bifunctional molybdenum cofactor biosynthesis protein MoaC/MoaB [Bacteroidota bacterium]|nr:bifunctional molybdenum cofactor biosynthesis protein MoaC/MoaB [Bacteroidota bacterium]